MKLGRDFCAEDGVYPFMMVRPGIWASMIYPAWNIKPGLQSRIASL